MRVADETGDEFGPQDIIAPAQPVGAHEDQNFAPVLRRWLDEYLTGAGLRPGAGDRGSVSPGLHADLKTGALEQAADVFLGRGVVHQHGELLNVAPVDEFLGFDHRVGTGQTPAVQCFFRHGLRLSSVVNRCG